MKKKIKYQIFAGLVGAILIGLIGFGYFAGYGGNKCNISYHSDPNNFSNLIQAGSCDCFCCKGLYGQGYESCGMFGLYSGLFLGALTGMLLIHLIWKIKFDKKQQVDTPNK